MPFDNAINLELATWDLPVPLPSIQRGPVLFYATVLLPLVLVRPSECSSVCSSFRSSCVRRPSALFPPCFIYWNLKR